MNFLEKPMLPDREVTLFLTSADMKNKIEVPRVLSLDEAIRHHGDLSLCYVGNKRFVTPPDTFAYYKEKLVGADLIMGSSKLKSPYPYDASYCAAVFGKFAIANEKVTDSTLLKILKEEFTFIDVRQGYAKCNICPISENAIITEDVGIAKAVSPYMDVLLITPGYVKLKGYKNGFIGGATGMADKDLLYVEGELKSHVDANKIYAFLEKYNVKTIEKEGELTDVGSIIPLAV